MRLIRVEIGGIMFRKWYVRAIIIILLLAAFFWLGKLYFYYQQQRTIELVNREMQFSGLKLMMKLDEIDQNVPYEYNMYSTRSEYQIDFNSIDLHAMVFSLGIGKSRYYGKVTYIRTQNEEHRLFGFNMLTPEETKKEILKKHGFKYKNEKGIRYCSKYGVNIRLDTYDLILWIDNPDNYYYTTPFEKFIYPYVKKL